MTHRWKMTDEDGKNARYYKSRRSAFIRAADRIVLKGSVELEELTGFAKFQAGTREGKFVIFGHYTDIQKTELKKAWRSLFKEVAA